MTLSSPRRVCIGGVLVDAIRLKWTSARLHGLAVVAAFFALGRNGFGVDVLSYPFVNELVPALPRLPAWVPLYHFLFSSPIGAINARLLGISSHRDYIAMHVAVMLGGIALLIRRVRAVHGDLAARMSLTLLAVSQVPTMLLQRLGGYDPYTVVFAGLAATGVSGPAAFAIGLAWSWSAFEQAAISMVGLFALRRLGGHSARTLVPLVGGLSCGRVALQFWLSWAGVQGNRMTWFRHFGWRFFLQMFGQGLMLLVLTCAGGAVVYAIAGWRSEWKSSSRRTIVAAVVVFGLPLTATVLVDDQTRVFSTVWWPLMLAYMIRVSGDWDARKHSAVALVALLAATIVPPILVSHGNPFLAQHHWFHLIG